MHVGATSRAGRDLSIDGIREDVRIAGKRGTRRGNDGGDAQLGCRHG
jgi:hypothetical protein